MKVRDIYISFNDVESRNQQRNRWNQTREACDYWLKNTIDENVKKFEKALIIGAGACNDFSLEKIVNMFDSTVIIDYDQSSMLQATKELSEENREKVKIVSGDFTGVIEQQIEYLKKIFNEDGFTSLIKQTEKFRDGLPKYFENNLSISLDNEFDFIFVDSITTQLFPPAFFIGVFSDVDDQFLSEHFKKINEVALTTNNRILIPFFRTIKRALVKEGVVAVSSDLFEINSKNRKYLNKNFGGLYKISLDILKNKELLMELKQYQLSGSIFEIERLISKKNIGLQKTYHFASWPWDFNEEKQYVTVGTSFIKK
ncbi:hypothetical protein [Cytobacillus horneckiae]|uniref:Class I SAM-dependent methyltransferase n=1 Tax=Cytobacillus horneckiae TaxID=549687 RepID=A0A2N0ZFA9_9BACI|nr:hypothetical protein [Cytobacillus horneckiae]MEC1155643.1 hypothetical protein [Cytobacillus horneckiae]MED2936961.1 hypothetical protein [Cytobacillus horneckiae]PKG28194.1 hypothetical protein CWS20_15235 [Cytobacillus horneckiae]